MDRDGPYWDCPRTQRGAAVLGEARSGEALGAGDATCTNLRDNLRERVKLDSFATSMPDRPVRSTNCAPATWHGYLRRESEKV